MNQVVVIHIIPNILQLKFTVVIISVHFLSYRLVQIRVEEAEELTPMVRSQIENED